MITLTAMHILLTIFFSNLSLAQTSKSPVSKNVNDFSFERYKGFEDRWKLVTVRFREDTKEQRFTYANPLALKALKAQSKDYPDGAVFAKIGMQTEDDPAFISSKQPNGINRYQIMIRNKKKYASTGGWGYAIFNASSEETPGDQVIKARACYACHQIVPERGEVFSQLMNFKVQTFVVDKERFRYTDLTTKYLPGRVTEIVKQKTVRLLEGSLRNDLFIGTLNEIQPTLLKEAKRTGMPALLLSIDRERFALVMRDEGVVCPNGHDSYSGYLTQGELPVSRTMHLILCD